jgi:hypothetical protein
MSNSYIQNRRAKFAAQLKDPNVRLQVAAMALSEDAVYSVPVIEALMNRCDFSGKTLMQMLHSGFYGPINRGKLPAFEQQLRHNPKLWARLNTDIDEVLAGSNIIEGYTDQGLPSDPNGRWPGMHIHGEVFNDWGGGPGGHAGARAWREAFMAGAKGEKA